MRTDGPARPAPAGAREAGGGAADATTAGGGAAAGGLAVALAEAAFAGGRMPALPADHGTLTARERWLAGVCLGALGRYGAAADLLLHTGLPMGSLAASAHASHLRQLGRHAEAEPMDRLALATAGSDTEARADALVGLVADAVGRPARAEARARLARATSEVAGAGWRAEVRLLWVTAEVALLGDEPEAAAEAATAAVAAARAAGAPRHAAKSLLVLGAAREAAGDASAAAAILRQAADLAGDLRLLPLVWPTSMLLARLLDPEDPVGAARERQVAASAIRAIRTGLPAAGTATLLARPDVRRLSGF